MSCDPDPMLRQIMRVRTPEEMIGVDLDDPAVWSRPQVSDPDYYLTLHWGGGPNIAGWPIEEPALTLPQKLALQLGRCKSVLRGWLAWHTRIDPDTGLPVMSTIAYSRWVDSIWGMTGRLRSHRHNGGQRGTVNTITDAVVLVMGFGQTASKRAWQTLGLIWFCGQAPRFVGHRFFNTWPRQTWTSCPGDLNTTLLAEEHHIRCLGVLRHRKAGSSRGRRVRAVTLKLTELAFLGRMQNRYTAEVAAAVEAFQQAYFVTGDKPGMVGFNTWKALAEA